MNLVGGIARLDRRVVPAGRDGAPTARWLELGGDAGFLAGDFARSRRQYEASLAAEPNPRLLLKLADVAWKSGDKAEERRLRERIYGSLRSPPAR